MKAVSEIIELFEQFRETEFDAESVVANSYASDSTTRRALKELCDTGFLQHRYIETPKSAKKVYRLRTVVTAFTIIEK